MKRWGLFLLRVSTGWLLVLWGLDKLLDPEHTQRVADAFYFGILPAGPVSYVLGVLEVLLGALIVVGLWRRKTYPVMFVVLLFGGLAVWQSIIDPWSWFMEGSNVLFYPSLIIFAGAMTLWGSIDEDTMALDAKKAA